MRHFLNLGQKLDEDLIIDLFSDYFTLIFAARDEIFKYETCHDLECANAGLDCHELILHSFVQKLKKHFSNTELEKLNEKIKPMGKYDDYKIENLSERFQNGFYKKEIQETQFSIFSIFSSFFS